MKRIILLVSMFMCFAIANAQNVNFKINDGISNGSLKSTIERNTSSLLSEFNAALNEDRSVHFNHLSITDEAINSISMLWANVTFKCIDNLVVERILETPNGYQVRNIPLELTSSDAILSEDTYQEAVIDFDENGIIQSFYFTVSTNLYMQIMKSVKDNKDMHRRQLILDYVEHFRTAYNQKDIAFLHQVFSDDAIIITGNVITTKPTDINILPSKQITYKSQTKAEYLSRLKVVFDNNKHIAVKFTDIKMALHSSKPNYYGVLLCQGYRSDTYSDDGYVFLLWDFNDEAHPQIHVRTWQPYYLDNSKTQVISEKDIFNINDFDL